MKEIIEALKSRNMNGYVVSSKEEAKEKVLELIKSGESVGYGGSLSLEQVGVLDALRKRKDITFFDRAKLTDTEKIIKLYHDILNGDVLLCGANALTEEGQIVNVDGRGNRVGAMIYGPKKVIMIAGRNKIVPNLAAAMVRIRSVAVPKNLARLNEKGSTWTEEEIWGQVGIIERQRDADRMHIIMVEEELGY